MAKELYFGIVVLVCYCIWCWLCFFPNGRAMNLSIWKWGMGLCNILGIFYILWCNLDSFFRGEKAFCSAECRDKHIRSDDHKEKCRSEALKSLEYSVSPCSGPLVFLSGVAVAWKFTNTYIVNNRRRDGNRINWDKVQAGTLYSLQFTLQEFFYNSICKNRLDKLYWEIGKSYNLRGRFLPTLKMGNNLGGIWS